jgi:transcriptional regulator GlxA family with amidase domain
MQTQSGGHMPRQRSLPRLQELQVLQALLERRRHLRRLQARAALTASPHWLRAVADPQIGRVLASMHDDMARLWTVEELAAQGGMSRA